MSAHPLYDSMEKYLREALQNREDIYQADREAVLDAIQKNPNLDLEGRTSAKQRGRGAAVVKELMSNNRWNMMQAVMFGVASLARSAIGIHDELRCIRENLEARNGKA